MNPTRRLRTAAVLLFAGTALVSADSSALAAETDGKRSAAPQEAAKPPAKAKTKAKAKSAAAKPAAAKRAAKPTAKSASRASVPSDKVASYVPLPRPRPRVESPALHALWMSKTLVAGALPYAPTDEDLPASGRIQLASADADAPLDGRDGELADRAVLSEALTLARAGKIDAATAQKNQIADPVGRTLVEWAILRSDGAQADFARYESFLRAHPKWPDARLFRTRAEARLWSDKPEPGMVLRFFAEQPPLSILGRLALARALLTRGDAAGAREHAQVAWREGGMSAAMEKQVLEMFGSLLDAGDHRVRMRARLFDDDFDAAMRAAKRLGSAEVAIVEARVAVKRGAKNAEAKLAAVPEAARADSAYLFTRAQWLRRKDRIADAAKAMLAARFQPGDGTDADAWWIEARALVRDLLDAGDPRTAYRVASAARLPVRESLRVDQPFTAGWVSLRFIGDAQTATAHFERIPQLTNHPTSHARAGYWLGRAAEAAGRDDEARRHYAEAARHTAAYYGQLARARLGHRDLPLRKPSPLSQTERAALRQVDLVRAVELLYAAGQRDLVVPFVSDLTRVDDVGVLTVIAETTFQQKDARAMLHLGKQAVVRGLDFDAYAFPPIGLPKYVALGKKAPASLIYAIARAESAFKPNAVSHAKAQGLMQVMPATGRTIARRLGIKFDLERLRNDPAYNVQLGAAEIAHLLDKYDGNHVLAFVGYNAGPGRAKEWVARYGDPRNPNVDVVDWVERIPITETRIYVQRVMENLQIYRCHFEDAPRLTIEADMRGARGG